ncbi:hypothetical protein N9W66_10595 [Luminiphilus sp.]|nr:hypothetical protein [Luminiphilus sp.]MDB2557774.1 hypothetical protein [Luminiphilus sp.]
MISTFSLTLLVLLIGVSLLILIVYLIGRVHELELKTTNAFASSSNVANTKPQKPHKIFSGLRGQQLWDQYVNLAGGREDEYDLLQDQDRFFALTELHLRTLLKAGLRSQSDTTSSIPPNPLNLTTLRGEFESYLPTSQAARIYTIGQSLGTNDSESDTRSSAVSEARDLIDQIAMAIGADRSLADNVMFAFE